MSKPRNAIEQIEWMRNLLAFVLVGSFVSCLLLFIFLPIPKSNEQIITYMLGQLSGMALTALGFYFVNKVGQDALDAKRTENTKAALEAITATAQVAGSDTKRAAEEAADATAGAAQDKADEFKGKDGA